MRVIKISVKPRENRLDKFLAQKIKTLSRSQAKKLIDKGFVKVDKKKPQPDYGLKKGESIYLEMPPPKTLEIKGEDLHLKIVYEDTDLLVIDKESGVVVHPTMDHPTGTVVNALIHHLGTKFTGEGDLRPGIVHRLDKGTSGLMVVGKNKQTVEKLKAEFKNRRVIKKYTLLVSKKLEPPVGEINKPIIRHPKMRNKFTVSSEGRQSQTSYKVLEYLEDKYSLVEAQPRTGRTHQLRVHLSSIGHPIVGDKLYGGKPSPRLFLHAGYLQFSHPTTKEKVEFTSDLPSKLVMVLDNIEGRL